MPADWLDGVRCADGVTLIQALLGNVGTGRGDVKGRSSSSWHYESESTEAPHRGRSNP